MKKNYLYAIRVDGFEIGEIVLPKMTQSERDVVRKQIADEYKVPKHYIRLQRKVVEAWVFDLSNGPIFGNKGKIK